MNWSDHFALNQHQRSKMGQTYAWLSGHFFYAGDLNLLLHDGLLFWVSMLQQRGVIDRFFFIRYAERGPHLRLRVCGPPSRLITEAVPFLEQQATDFLNRHPSVRPANAPADWLPNDTVQWIAYEPEIQRYGGPTAIQWAELEFQASSEAVAGAIASAHWTYHRSLGVAIQLQAAYSFYLLDTPAERAEFWAMFSAGWSAHLLTTPGSSSLVDGASMVNLFNQFGVLFNRQKTILGPYFDDLWAMLITGNEFDERWYMGWLDHLRQHRYALDTLAGAGQIIVPGQFKPSASTSRQYLLHSYVHMTNNRLGISNYDEGYLGYLMQQLLAGR